MTRRSPTTAAPSPQRRKPRDRPLLIVLTGDGKGKSHVAPSGCSARVGARLPLRRLPVRQVRQVEGRRGARRPRALGGIDWEKMGDGWSWLSQGPRRVGRPAPARAGPRSSAAIAEERYEFLLLDEFTYPMKWGWIDVDDVVATLRDRPGFQHVVITGRDAPPEADRGRRPRHARWSRSSTRWTQGIRAQQGIEW